MEAARAGLLNALVAYYVATGKFDCCTVAQIREKAEWDIGILFACREYEEVWRALAEADGEDKGDGRTYDNVEELLDDCLADHTTHGTRREDGVTYTVKHE